MNTKMTIDELATLPVAPGLQEQYTGESGLSKEYIDNAVWFNGPNGSIFLKYVPQDMTKQEIRKAFQFLGRINRIDIVLNKTPRASGSYSIYRMAFIHFDYWYSSAQSLEVRHHIVHCFPRAYQLYSLTAMRELSITINTTPVPKTTYNLDQMSDMLQRLQEDYYETIQRQANQIALLTEKVALLEKSQNRTEIEINKFNRWANHTIGDIDELRQSIKDQDLTEIRKDLNAKSVEYSSMSKVFSRDIGELIQIRQKVLPEVMKLSTFMMQNPEYQKFSEK